MKEYTGTHYICPKCKHKWAYNETHCPNCGNPDFEDDYIVLDAGFKDFIDSNGKIHGDLKKNSDRIIEGFGFRKGTDNYNKCVRIFYEGVEIGSNNKLKP